MNAGQQANTQRDMDAYRGSPNAAQTAPPSQVVAAQSSLDSQIGTLHDLVGTLEQRLQSVLSAVPERSGKDGGAIRPVASTVAQRIQESSSSVSYACQRVTALIDRLEV